MKKYLNILSVVILVFVCFFTLTGCKSGVKVKDDLGDMLIQTTVERGIHLTKKNTKHANGSYTLEALVTPADATNKKLIWSLDVAQEYDDLQQFISDNNMMYLEEYVELTVSDDTLSCNVRRLDGCPVQLKIVVKSQHNPSIKAECTIDFYKKINKVTLHDIEIRSRTTGDFANNNDYLHELTINDGINNNNVECSFLSYEDIFTYGANIDYLYYEEDVSNGTFQLNNEVIYYFKLSEQLIDLLSGTGFSDFMGEWVKINLGQSSLTILSMFEEVCDHTNPIFIDSLKNCSTLFEIRIEIVQKYNNEVVNISDTFINFVNFDLSDNPVTNIDLDYSNIIF